MLSFAFLVGIDSDSLDHRPTFSLPLLPVSVALLLFASRSLMWWSFCLVLYFFFRKKFFDVHLGAFGFAIFVDGLVLLHGPFSHAILLLGCLVLWIFWLQAGVFQWHSMLLTFIVGAVCLRYGQSYLGAGDTLLVLSWSGGLPLEELLRVLFLASLFGISFFSVYFICHKKKLEKLPFIPFLSSALLIVLHFRY